MRVRIFGYRGVTQITEKLPKHYHADSVHIIEEPYEFAQALESNGATPVSSVADTVHNQVTVLKIEVPDGEGIRYEIRPPGGGGNAVTTDSPRLQGVDFVSFYPGWTFEFIDLASAP